MLARFLTGMVIQGGCFIGESGLGPAQAAMPKVPGMLALSPLPPSELCDTLSGRHWRNSQAS